MAKKYAKLWENASKMMPKRCPKSMINRWIFRTCDFLIFAKSITLKSFFYMIRGTRIPSKIHKKSMQIRCSKKVCRKHETCQKMEPKWEPKSMKIHPKTTLDLNTKIWRKIVRPVCPADMYGPPLLRVIRHKQTVTVELRPMNKNRLRQNGRIKLI